MHAVLNTSGVKCASDDVVADAWQVLNPAASDEHDTVLLQVVTDARDVGCDFYTVCQPDSGDFAQS